MYDPRKAPCDSAASQSLSARAASEPLSSRQALTAIVFCLLVATTIVLGTSVVASEASTPAQDCLGGANFSVARDGDLLVIPIAIGVRQYYFALDTGCAASILDKTFRPMLGESVGIARLQTPDGVELHSLWRAPEAAIASRRLSGLSEILCTDLSVIRNATGLDIYGLLGMDFLQDKRLRIDFDRGELAFLAAVPDGAGSEIPLHFTPTGVPTVTLTISGFGEETFTVDTGDVWLSAGMIEAKLFTRLLETGSAIPLEPGLFTTLSNAPAHTRRACLKAVEVGKFRHEEISFTEAAVNALGTGYLSRYVVTFDFPGRKMYLKPGLRFAEPRRRGLSGIDVWCPDGIMTVRSVRKGSAAERAGLKAGDVIEQIGSRPARSLAVFEVIRLFCVQGTHRLAVTRGNERLQMELVLELPADPSADGVRTNGP